jgi:hypothetical protein
MLHYVFDQLPVSFHWAVVGGEGGKRIQSSRRCKRYSSPITGLNRPRGFQAVEVPRFQNNRNTKVVKLSAVRTGRLYTPGNIPGTHFC